MLHETMRVVALPRNLYLIFKFLRKMEANYVSSYWSTLVEITQNDTFRLQKITSCEDFEVYLA